VGCVCVVLRVLTRVRRARLKFQMRPCIHHISDSIAARLYAAMSKVPIETLPVELRIKIYELGDISGITEKIEYVIPWARTILMSGILNDKDAIEIAAVQKEDKIRRSMCNWIAYSGNIPMMKWARSGKAPREDDAAEEQMKKSKKRRKRKKRRVTGVAPFRRWSTVTSQNAARFGHLKLLKWLREQGCPWDHETFVSAVRFGNIEILDWLYQKKCPWSRVASKSALESGNWDVLRWLCQRKCPWDARSFSAAVSAAVGTGNVDMAQLLHEQERPAATDTVLDVAVGAGNLTMVKLLVDRGCRMSKYTCAVAARNGHLEILTWLHEQGCPWDSDTFVSAVHFGTKSGNWDVLKWLCQRKCPVDVYDYRSFSAAISAAVGTGNLDMAQFLHEQERPAGTDTVLDVAVGAGNLTMVKLLVDRGCRMSKYTCAVAARTGHLEILTWLHEQGCPWNEDACTEAAREGHLDALIWLREHGCPWNEDTLYCAEESGMHDVFEWAKSNGCPYPADMSEEDY
jgi:uncharacterized protein YciI